MAVFCFTFLTPLTIGQIDNVKTYSNVVLLCSVVFTFADKKDFCIDKVQIVQKR